MAIPVTTRSGKGSELTITEGDDNWTNLARSATESEEGNIEIATQAEVTAMIDIEKAVTPGYLRPAVEEILGDNPSSLLPIAMGSFNGGAASFKQSFGVVQSIATGTTGVSRIIFSSPRSSADYIVTATSGPPSESFPLDCVVDAKTASSFNIYTYLLTGGSTRELSDMAVDFVVYDLDA